MARREGKFDFSDLWVWLIPIAGLGAAIAREAAVRDTTLKEERARQEKEKLQERAQQDKLPSVNTRGTYRSI